MDEKTNTRLLDDDEVLSKIFEIKSSKSVFEKLGIKKETNFKIIFKKYLWLGQELEEIDYKKDFVRLSLIRC